MSHLSGEMPTPRVAEPDYLDFNRDIAYCPQGAAQVINYEVPVSRELETAVTETQSTTETTQRYAGFSVLSHE